VTTELEPWIDKGSPPTTWQRPWDWPEDWADHIAQWRELGIEAGTWQGN
jgi:hypothetical protein